VIKLQCSVADWGHGYRCVSAPANNKITLDRDVTGEISVGDLLELLVYDTNSKEVCLDTYTVESVAGDEVTIVETWIVTPTAGCRVAVAAADVIKLRRIIRIDPTVDNYFKITVETYDPDLFYADELDPNNPNANYIWPAPAGQINGPLTRAEMADLIAQLLPPQPNIEIPWPGNLTWTGSGGDTVAWSATDGDEPISFRYRGTTYEITADSTTDEFIYWDPNYTTTFRHTNLMSTVLAAGGWLMCRDVDGVATPSIPMQTMHGALSLNNGPAEAGADVTSSHTASAISGQGALATRDNVSLDSHVIDGTTYKRMLAAWRAEGDTTKIDGGKIYTGSILAGSIATYNLTAANAAMENLFVKNAHIENLTIATEKIAPHAATTSDAGYVNGSYTLTDSWYTIAECTLTDLTGEDVHLSFGCFLAGTGGANLKVMEGAETIWSRDAVAFGDFIKNMVDTDPGTGSNTYKLQGQRTALSPEVTERFISGVSYKK